MRTLLLLLLSLATALAAEETATHRVTGLFSPEREADLRAAVETVPGVRLESVDFDHAEAVFRYDPAVAFKDTKPDKIVERLNNAVRTATRQTLGIAAPDATPKDKLQRVEIPISMLDCKACCLAVYETVAKIDGVTQAAVSLDGGTVSALIDPARTGREKVEAALKARGTLLVPQRVDGIEGGGFAGGVVAEEDADGGAEEERDDDRRG